MKQELYYIELVLSGNQSKAEIGALEPMTIRQRLQVAGFGSAYSTYGPTATQRQSLVIASEQYTTIRERLNALIMTRLPDFERRLHAAGAPWTPGSAVPRF